MTMPTFLIIGTAKAATTSLYHYLNQHPEVYMSPVKEPRFFCYEGENINFSGPGDELVRRSSITDIDAYRALFDKATNQIARGEASPNYLYIPKAAERIQYYIPTAKLIAILRNPVERAYSNFMHNIRDGYEPLTDFSKAIHEEEVRIRNNWAPRWHYKRQGYYHKDLTRFFDKFDRDQIRVFLYEEFSANPSDLLRDVFEFLEVDATFTPDISNRFNVSGVPQSKSINFIMKQQNRFKSVIKTVVPEILREAALEMRNKNLAKPTIPTDVRDLLLEAYNEDILLLEKLIDMDLSAWLEPQQQPRSEPQ